MSELDTKKRCCTECGRSEALRWYGMKTGRIVCYVCYQAKRKKIVAAKRRELVYDMWGSL